MLYILFIIFLLVHTIKEIDCLNRKDKSYQGRFTADISEYELLVPHKVNSNGDLLSFSLPEFFTHDYGSRRRKRDLAHPDIVHYKIFFNGNDHHIELWPNHGFVTSETLTEHHYPGSYDSLAPRKMRKINPVLCHFTGRIRDIDGSSVALSLCDGLIGYLKTNEATYYIEPVKDYGPNELGHHLHIIHSSDNDSKKSKRNCGTENWSLGWAKAFQNYYKVPEKIKRSPHSSLHRYLEVLVVADKKFLEYHRDKDYENYILTIMNMVSDFYHDASTGNQLDVVVVRIIYLDQKVDTLDLTINSDASSTLNSFCKWQNDINPKIDHPQHHDIAILLTRDDICTEGEAYSCDLLGLANMASACTPTESCAINEDKGIILGVVVAHEIGHIVGCDHDEETTSGCSAKIDDGKYHVMSPFVKMATSVWSKCSRKYMTELFENNLGDCLNDEPQETSYPIPNMLPGSIYDPDYQCNLIFPNSTHCPINMDKFCEKLYCKTGPETCRSNGDPPADGSKCGEGKWCYKQKCVTVGQRPAGIPGGWGNWSEWSSCSRSCGGGVQVAERDCNSPAPQNNGLYCIGERKKIKICSTDSCPSNSLPFRAEQCSKFDKIPKNGKLHSWKPFTPTGKAAENPCVLYCINEKKVFTKMSPRAKDGTPCQSGTNYMCISGECRKVGCDWILDSNTVQDKCGICNGDGTQCKLVNGTFEQIGKGYVKVLTLPKGARNIFIEEIKSSENIIAVADANGKNFFLNANRNEEKDGEKSLGNNIALYMHPEPNKEELIIAGPLNQPLTIFIAFFKPKNIGYKYEYYIRNSNNDIKPTRNLVSPSMNYHWEFVEWSTCDKRCDGGISKAHPVCVSNKGDGEVSDKFCDGIIKPEVKTKICNRDLCRIKWHTGEWSDCSGCLHNSGSQDRRVWCAREAERWEDTDVLTDEVQCSEIDGTKPALKQICVGECGKKCRRTRNVNFPLNDRGFVDVYKRINVWLLEPDEPEDNFYRNPRNIKKGVVQDHVPKNDFIIEEVHLTPNLFQNLSDKAFEKLGDKLVGKVDFLHEKIYKGKEAFRLLSKENGNKSKMSYSKNPQRYEFDDDEF